MWKWGKGVEKFVEGFEEHVMKDKNYCPAREN